VRSRGRKAPWWPSGSVSRSSAQRSMAWPAPWRRPRRPRPARGTACPRRGAVARPGRRAPRPRPWPQPWPGLRPAVHPHGRGRGVRRCLPPAARRPRQIRGAKREAALKPTFPQNLCFVERTALLNEMAPTETATSDSSEVPYRAAGPLPEGSASASSAGDLHGHYEACAGPSSAGRTAAGVAWRLLNTHPRAKGCWSWRSRSTSAVPRQPRAR